ncbi:MAG: nucleoside hydrolase [Anaerolineae bacterium]|nr:nucleoside hydrolase [Anaerolineae bacterium]
MSTTYPLILDTDIGTDIDDLLALAFILNSTEVDLLGITCVYGDVNVRAQIALTALKHYGRDVPVYLGAELPLLRLRDIYWGGHEGEGIVDQGVAPLPVTEGFGPSYIIETVRANPGQVHVAAIGPLTNIAIALQQAPDIAEKVASFVIMGGVVRGNDGLHLPIAEHNIICDVHAAHVVFASGAPILLTPLNITVQTNITRAHLARIQAKTSPFQKLIADQIARYPRFAQLGHTSAHDPLAIAAFLHPDLVETMPVSVEVETSGRVSIGATHAKANPEGNVQLVTGVDVAAFEELLVQKLETEPA